MPAAANFYRDPQISQAAPSAFGGGLRVDAGPYAAIRCFVSFHCGMFGGDLPMLRFGFHVFLHSRRASVVSLQVIVSFHHAIRE
jgi:tetrahydromethanopterin S-methyltransferase subunit E